MAHTQTAGKTAKNANLALPSVVSARARKPGHHAAFVGVAHGTAGTPTLPPHARHAVDFTIGEMGQKHTPKATLCPPFLVFLKVNAHRVEVVCLACQVAQWMPQRPNSVSRRVFREKFKNRQKVKTFAESYN